MIVLMPLTLHAGTSGILPVALSSPVGDVVIVTLTSSNPAILSVSSATVTGTANVLIPAGATSANLRVAAGTTGTVTITATASGFAPAMTQVMVVP